MRFETVFIDLDDTIYPTSAGLWNVIRDRIRDYMQEHLQISPDDIPRLQQEYLERYGTTLNGLQRHHQVDVDNYLAYVHDVPLQRYLRPDPAVRAMLLSLPQPHWIFTNADEAHAQRVLAALDLSDCFQGIIDLRSNGFISKPNPQAYRQALALAGGCEPEACLLVEDSPRNLRPAREMGFTTVLVSAQAAMPEADYTIGQLAELKQALPALWETGARPLDKTGNSKEKHRE